MKLWLVGYLNCTGLVRAPDEVSAIGYLSERRDCRGRPVIEEVTEVLSEWERNGGAGFVAGMEISERSRTPASTSRGSSGIRGHEAIAPAT